METNLQALLEEIRSLEKSVVEQIKQKETDLLYKIKNRKVIFEQEVIKKHKALRKSIYRFLTEAPLMYYLVVPIIYSMIIPIVIMDIFVSFYQMTCFPVYGIRKVSRRDYIAIDRHRLNYLNWIQKINCDYCGYFNGVIAYVREVASRTEQYFCPIRHALLIKGVHPRHAAFAAYGDASNYQEKLKILKDKLREPS
ncbi:MAG: hypothetical protein AABZ31_11890 [Bdellovibrionota bacterium]